MSREVVKHVGQRAYRYVVERVADPATGKSKRRWRYIGPVQHEDAAAEVSAVPAQSTRDRLLDAFEELLKDRPFSALTISAVGQAAGLAHGTFYRYFRDKDALLEGGIGRIRDAVDATEPHLGLEVGTIPQERERIVRWLDLLVTAKEKTALIRAWYLHRTATGDLAAVRRARRDEQLVRLTGYLEELDRAGCARISEPRKLAIGIYAAIDGLIKREVIEDERLDDETIGALRTIVTRSIFGS